MSVEDPDGVYRRNVLKMAQKIGINGHKKVQREIILILQEDMVYKVSIGSDKNRC